jgi:FkbM family methyltransferase
MLPLRERVVRWLAGNSASIQSVRWHRDGRRYEFDVPGDNVWISLKDDLLLREYEWMGVDLASAGGVVVDAGAHVGTFTATAAAHAAHVVAVEPNPANLALLRANLERNAIDNVEVVEGALWPGGEAVELALSGPTSAGSVVDDSGGGSSGTTVSVPAVDLDALVERVGAIDLLKLDIEGAEFELLRAASPAALAQIDVIVGELHLWADPSGGEELRRRLEGEGFDVEIRRGPINFPAQSLRSLRRNWSSLEGHLRLKLTIAGSYGLAAVVSRIPRLRRRLAAKELRLFLARRPR